MSVDLHAFAATQIPVYMLHGAKVAFGPLVFGCAAQQVPTPC